MITDHRRPQFHPQFHPPEPPFQPSHNFLSSYSGLNTLKTNLQLSISHFSFVHFLV
jgi:hypothetical protein